MGVYGMEHRLRLHARLDDYAVLISHPYENTVTNGDQTTAQWLPCLRNMPFPQEKRELWVRGTVRLGRDRPKLSALGTEG